MNSLKKLQGEKLEIREKEVVFTDENTTVLEFRNASTGNENQLY